MRLGPLGTEIARGAKIARTQTYLDWWKQQEWRRGRKACLLLSSASFLARKADSFGAPEFLMCTRFILKARLASLSIMPLTTKSMMFSNPSRNFSSVCVFCSSNESAGAENVALASACGSEIAARRMTLVSGHIPNFSKMIFHDSFHHYIFTRSNIYGVLLFCEGIAEGFFQVAAPLP